MEFFFEALGWIRIVLSPGLILSFLGYAVYYNYPTNLIFFLAISLGALGFVIGGIMATRIWKKYGTMRFLSRVDSTPDIDEHLKNKKEQ